jgi:carbonic anhydrase
MNHTRAFLRILVSGGLILSGGWLVLANRSIAEPPAATPATASSEAAAPTPGEALERLMAGNRRYIAGPTEPPPNTSARREQLRAAQHPFAIIVGCSDSRVAPELVFDQWLGDLFVARVAGNITGPDVTGSVAYAVHHLHAPLVVVLGHQNCGAVKAALMSPAELAKEPSDIQALVREVQPSLKNLSAELDGAAKLQAAIKANVRRTMNELEQAESIKEAMAAQKLKVIGAVYSLDTGKVELLP